jgi:hypothetical protein
MQENLVRLEAELAAALRALDASQCQLTPVQHPGKWSIQQIVEHLVMSYRSTIELLDGRIEKKRPTQAKLSVRQHLGQLFLVGLGFFPAGIDAPAAVRPTLPDVLLDGASLIRRIHDALTDFESRIETARTLFGDGPFASHMILGPLSADQWTRFHLVHGRHHIKQIRRVRRDHLV